ncbi:MAG: DUF86 domain-containing protein [Patescibacteria group bacterium]|mgnify:CR=1 FL=1
MDDKTPDVYLHHILDAIGRIQRYVTGVEKEAFLADDSMVAAAVVREFEIIGEAMAQIADAYKKQYESVPWREIIDMRNRLIHGYFSVDYEIVWKSATEDLPILKQQIEDLLKGYA